MTRSLPLFAALLIGSGLMLAGIIGLAVTAIVSIDRELHLPSSLVVPFAIIAAIAAAAGLVLALWAHRRLQRPFQPREDWTPRVPPSR